MYCGYVVFACVSGYACMLLVCLHGRMHVCKCVRLDGGCVVFVCVSGHVCMVIVRVRVGVFMFVNVCGCTVSVLCLYVSFAMCVC